MRFSLRLSVSCILFSLNSADGWPAAAQHALSRWNRPGVVESFAFSRQFAVRSLGKNFPSRFLSLLVTHEELTPNLVTFDVLPLDLRDWRILARYQRGF